MEKNSINRKDFFKKMGILSVGALSASTLISACGGAETPKADTMKADAMKADTAMKPAADPCADLTGLTDQEKSTRDALGYIAETEIPEQVCTNCNFWQAQVGDSPCGGCQLMKGPIHPDGWCKSWFAKAT